MERLEDEHEMGESQHISLHNLLKMEARGAELDGFSLHELFGLDACEDDFNHLRDIDSRALSASPHNLVVRGAKPPSWISHGTGPSATDASTH